MIVKNPTFWNWLFKEHPADLKTYLNDWVDRFSAGDVDRYMQEGYVEPGTVLADFIQDPHLGYQVLSDWITNHDNVATNQKRLFEYIREPGVFVILLLGMPDSGKTTTAYSICDRLRDEYQIVNCAPIVEEGTLPDWVDWKQKPSQLQNKDLAIVDESTIQTNARRSGSRDNLDDLMWLAIGRHRGAKMIYISQISSISDVNLTRWANIIISKGYGSSAVGASEIERKHIADNPVLQYLKPEANYAGVRSLAKDWAVVSAKGTTYMVYLPKPDFMSDKLSRSYMSYLERAKGDQKLADQMAMNDARQMMDNGNSAESIQRQMITRGFMKSREFWKRYTGEWSTKGRDNFE